MKIYIAYKDNGCEGKSLPLAAFSTLALANVYKEGSKADYGSGIEIIELELQELKMPFDPILAAASDDEKKRYAEALAQLPWGIL